MNAPRVLYLDDDRDSCEMMKLLLSTSFPTLDVEAVSSGSEAIERASSARFDMYILDALIPGVSGFDVCREIRSLDNAVPVYFYTGVAGSNFRDMAQDAGCTGFLVKPNDMDELIRTVGRSIERQAAASAAFDGIRS